MAIRRTENMKFEESIEAIKKAQPETFVKVLLSRIEEKKESIKSHDKKLLELNKKIDKAEYSTIEEKQELDSNIFWEKNMREADAKAIHLIEDIIHQLGWSCWYDLKKSELGGKVEEGWVILRKGKIIKEHDDLQTWFDSEGELKQYLECIEPLEKGNTLHLCTRNWEIQTEPIKRELEDD
jgi:hypothetical protein